jgi:1-acyl-sn-glycerol-3-phosphate acyltransferase
MFQKDFANQLNIISESMPSLTLGQRWFLKSLLFCSSPLVQTEGLDRVLISKDPIIFAFNHNCSYETILVPSYLIALRKGRKISFIIDWMFGHFPLISWIFKQIDPIYVFNKKSSFFFLNHFRSHVRQDKLNHSFNVYQQCIKRLHAGQSIGIFPEGTRNHNPKTLLKGKKGIGYIALGSGVPVIPIGIDFPCRLKKSKIPKFGPLIIRFGPEMNFSEERSTYLQISNSDYIHPVIKRKISDYLSDKVTYGIMNEISRLSGKQYPFQAPIPPVAVKRFLFNPELKTSGEIINS